MNKGMGIWQEEYIYYASLSSLSFRIHPVTIHVLQRQPYAPTVLSTSARITLEIPTSSDKEEMKCRERSDRVIRLSAEYIAGTGAT